MSDRHSSPLVVDSLAVRDTVAGLLACPIPLQLSRIGHETTRGTRPTEPNSGMTLRLSYGSLQFSIAGDAFPTFQQGDGALHHAVRFS
jgi:hypothetical protein